MVLAKLSFGILFGRTEVSTLYSNNRYPIDPAQADVAAISDMDLDRHTGVQLTHHFPLKTSKTTSLGLEPRISSWSSPETSALTITLACHTLCMSQCRYHLISTQITINHYCREAN